MDKPPGISPGHGPRIAIHTPAAARLRALLVTIVHIWPERRRQRLDLTRLADWQLHDLGLDRIEAARECRKPFWRS